MKHILLSLVLLFTFYSCRELSRFSNNNDKSNDNTEITDYEVLDETDSIEIISRVIQTFDDGFSIPLVELSLRDKNTGRESSILKTVEKVSYGWDTCKSLDFEPISIDSLLAAHRVYIIKQNPLKLIVEGCPDMRNEYSYFVDVANRKAWFVPSCSGYLGATEEGFMIFRSYRYFHNPDLGGRYTFLHIYNENGRLVDSLDLEHANFVSREYNRNQI